MLRFFDPVSRIVHIADDPNKIPLDVLQRSTMIAPTTSRRNAFSGTLPSATFFSVKDTNLQVGLFDQQSLDNKDLIKVEQIISYP